ncbi:MULTISPECIES: DUF2225 domain-containing protein [Paenibacillus]|uniref:DUF2225 domain-containing protein n=1 Tax=Paenibacillus barengoltzii J12 TaxID=935846 RepID=A0ABY1M4I9_9BACL|nr:MULTISPECIES: DUF2225 domain-containing protein [Paenibacillus]MEC2344544.1 DUF2225 domain-containing protein [Paenibacillus barengoltzii]SMF33361.1 hypothetical protein SAMN02744102_02697 [Paenibacillus barengoltzii]SMF56276.1 hypothetical protein SAMN02744124_03727 [Paenibacillus barengoltzii J12]
MELEPLYQIKVTCIHCQNEFSTSRVRPSFKRAVRTDTDFCSYYQKENPDYYVVRVCPSCGFASTENSVPRLTDRQRTLFQEAIGSRFNQKDYGGRRDWETALETYKLALICAQTIGETERIIASLLHHIAWLYRYKNNVEQEKRFLQFALEAYIRVYEKEGVGGSDARLMYLIGELNRRVGKYNDAVKWFGRVINDKKIMDAAMIRASREQWALLREEMMNGGHELPEEMRG